ARAAERPRQGFPGGAWEPGASYERRLGRAVQTQAAEVWHGLERLRQRLDRFPDLPNLPGLEQAEFLALSEHQVRNPVRVELHEPAAGGVHRQRIRAHDE